MRGKSVGIIACEVSVSAVGVGDAPSHRENKARLERHCHHHDFVQLLGCNCRDEKAVSKERACQGGDVRLPFGQPVGLEHREVYESMVGSGGTPCITASRKRSTGVGGF